MTYKNLFIIGLLFEVTGQLLLAPGNDFVYALKPIDFAHWSLLIGVVLLLPQAVSFPKTIFSYLGAPTAIIGIVSIIGMCVLDFVFWSFPTQELRSEFGNHLTKISVIWKPFMSIGPNFTNVGLLLLSLNYFKSNKLGVVIIILATLILFFGRFIPSRIILVYLLTAFGFAIIFYQKTTNENKV